MCASVAVTVHTAKVTTRVHSKCLVKIKNVLNLCVEDMNRKHISDSVSEASSIHWGSWMDKGVDYYIRKE